jgi:CRP-like cAMP-binding protein
VLNQIQVSQLLGTTDIFAKLKEPHLQAIANACKVIKYKKDTKIVEQGEPGDQLFILSTGRVAVIHEEKEIGTEQLVTTLEPRHCFGETSLLSQTPRSATIKALEETICVVLAKRSFESVLEQVPAVAVEVSRFLAARLHHQCRLTGFRFVSLEEMPYDSDLHELFPLELLRRLKAIPIGLQEGTLTVALTNPNRPSVVKQLREATPEMSIEAVVCAREDYEAFARRHYKPLEVEVPILLPGDVSAELCLPSGEEIKAPLSNLLREALNRKVEQILIDNGRIVVPKDSTLQTFCVLPEGAREDILTKQLETYFFSESEGPEVTSTVLHLEPNFCHLELSRLPTLSGPRYSLGILESNQQRPTLSELFPQRIVRERLTEQLTTPGRLTILAGAPRSGLSTTVHGLLCAIVAERGVENIVSLETHPRVTLPAIPQINFETQRESLLQAALAQFPKLIAIDRLLGEELPALARYLVEGPATLVAVQADDPIEQLSLLGAQGETVVEAVDTVLHQKLVPNLCPHCRSEHTPSASVTKQLEKCGFSPDETKFFHSPGCRQCHQTGTLGKSPVIESLTLKPILRELLLAGRSARSVRKTARDANLLVPFHATASLLLKQGNISPATCLRHFGERYC